MRIKKCHFVIISLLITSLSLTYSCKKNNSIQMTEEQNIYTKETEIKIKSNTPTPGGGTTPPQQAVVKSEVSVNVAIPSNVTEEQLTTYLNQNISNINGEITFKVNGEIFYKSTVTNGVETILIGGPVPQGQGGRDGECSYEGVRQCANKTLYSMGTVSKIVCAFTFYECYAVAAADCIEKNCIKKGTPPIPFEVMPDSGPTPGNGNGGTNPTAQIPGLGVNNFSYGNSIDHMKNIINGHSPALSTKIYFNNGKYYSNANFSCLLPTGYYTSNLSTVYQVQGGQLVGSTVINPCPSCPVLPFETVPDPFAGCGSGLPTPTPTP